MGLKHKLFSGAYELGLEVKPFNENTEQWLSHM